MKKLKMSIFEGVYMMFTGPSFETCAEIKMAGRLGADVIGMSSVPEAIIANYLGIKVMGMSCVCNMAAGISLNPLSA
jgi:purine-nucleoside phosphorylase